MTEHETIELLDEVWYELVSFLGEIINNQKKHELMPIDAIVLGMKGLTFVNDLLTIMLGVVGDDLDSVNGMLSRSRVGIDIGTIDIGTDV